MHHLERIQWAATRWVKGFRGLTYEERLQALKLQPLGKRRLRNNLVLTHKILSNYIDLDATQLFRFSRRLGLRRSSIRLLHRNERTRRRRNSFACRVVNNRNRRIVNGAAQIQKTFRHMVTHTFFSLFYFRLNVVFLGTLSLPDQ